VKEKGNGRKKPYIIKLHFQSCALSNKGRKEYEKKILILERSKMVKTQIPPGRLTGRFKNKNKNVQAYKTVAKNKQKVSPWV
jgi:hypothetical protein